MQRESPPKIGELLPKMDLYDLKGSKLSVPDDLGNKIVIIRFWGDCCSYNINEMSRIDQINRKYEEKGLKIVTIHTGGTRKVAEDFTSMLKIKYPVLLDADSRTAKRYGVSKLPCTFILDRNGVIRGKIVGQVDGAAGAAYEKFITPLLN